MGKITGTPRISRLIEPAEMQIGDHVKAAKDRLHWHLLGLQEIAFLHVGVNKPVFEEDETRRLGPNNGQQ